MLAGIPTAKEMRAMTTIGIVGSGHAGRNLAQAAIAHGYDMVLSNSQGPDSLAGLVKELGPRARAAVPAQAAAADDFAIVAIPLTTIDQVTVEPLAGKVVIATINYFPQRFGVERPEFSQMTQARAAGRRPCRRGRAGRPDPRAADGLP
jgi:predicted dinucleotide-binding enzyme